MTASFPTSLPPPLGGSLEPSYNDGIVQDTGEIGPIRHRRRTTRVLKNWSFTMRLASGADKATWDTFFEKTINYGVDNFTWTLSGTVYTVQFLQKPKINHVVGDIYDVSLTIGEV